MCIHMIHGFFRIFGIFQDIFGFFRIIWIFQDLLDFSGYLRSIRIFCIFQDIFVFFRIFLIFQDFLNFSGFFGFFRTFGIFSSFASGKSKSGRGVSKFLMPCCVGGSADDDHPIQQSY